MSFRNDPFEEMNRFFEHARRAMLDSPAGALPATHDDFGIDANVDLSRTDDGYVVMADLPGFEKEDLSIRYDDGTLYIWGETAVEEETEHTAHRRSRRVREQVTLPMSVLEDEITASYHNGVLEVTLPTEADDAVIDSQEIEIE